jgi:protease-4
MKRLRNIVLVLLAIGLLIVIFSEPPPVEIEPDSTLVVEIDGSYVEASRTPFIERLMGDGHVSFLSLLSRFNMASRDERIARVVVVIRTLDIGWAKVEEIRGALARLREAGKPTYAYLEMASFSAGKEYYLATGADEIHVIQGGTVPVVGLAAEYLFLGGLFEKLGIDFDVAKAGRFKSAVESFTRSDMSPASLEMANSLLDDMNTTFVQAIADGRKLDVATVERLIDEGPILPESLLSDGLIDDIGHLEPLLDSLGGPVVRAEKYSGVTLEDLGVESKAEIALVYGTGNVVEGDGNRGGEPVFSARVASKAILDAAEDPEIDAIILRIDSPGGSALASEQIWEAMTRARERGKPLIASFSDLAASGGYYAATGADYIVSDGNTLTGSIGVFALRPSVGGALERIGVTMQSLTRGRHADFLLSGPPLSEGARERLQLSVERTYALFLERVAQARDMEVNAVDEVAQGRVWTGRQAFDRGLVDELGGLHEAVIAAKRELGLAEDADAVLVPFPAPRSLSQELADMFQMRASAWTSAWLPLPQGVRRLEAMLSQLPPDRPLLVPPLLVDIR